MAIPVINVINFQADWTPSIYNLKPEQHSTVAKVCLYAKSFLFYIPNFFLEPLIRWIILPSSSPFLKNYLNKNCLNSFNTFLLNERIGFEKLNLTTPDNVLLKGHFIKHQDHDNNPNSRVIILFHGNGDMYQTLSWGWMYMLLSESTTPYSFLLFNPRGVGVSENGTANSKNLLIDSETVYQFANNNLGISEDRIDMYGHSLGGAEAAQLKKLHPATGGKVLLDRTFSDLDVEASYFLRFLPNFIKNFALSVLKKFGWEFNSYEALRSIQDPVHIFYHKKDRIIPTDCSLGKAVLDLNPNPEQIHVHAYDSEYQGNWHMISLDELNLVDDYLYRTSRQFLKSIF